ncbi:MAG: autotransporter-associated beta strand repeat-containing protein, partial [Akkermansia sp.]
ETLTVSGPLALGGAASSILMDVGTATDKIVYANAANPTGNNVTLDLNIIGATVGTAYTIIQTTGTGALTLDMFTKHILNRGAEANLTLNADNDLIVTVTNAGAAADLTWAGTAGFNTWKTLGDSTPWTGGNTDNQFYAGDKVTFADAGTTKTVNIVGDVAPGSITITGNNYVLSGTGGIIGNGAMTVNIGGADALKQATLNTSNAKYTGKITLTSGTLILGATNAAGTGDISFDGGTLYIGADNALNGNIISATTGKTINLGVAAGGSYALGNVNLSSVAFTKVGEGSLILTPTADFTQAITIAAGALEINKSAGSVSMSGVLSGAGKLVKSGTGTLVLSGTNTYSGGTSLNIGTLQISNSSALGTGMTTVKSGATLEATSAMTLNVSKLDIQKGSILKHGANAITLNTDSTTSTFNGDFNGAATLTINGGGTLVFNGIHKKDGGDINITGATLDLSQGGRLFNGGYSTGHLSVNSGGKLVLNSWEYSEQSANLG